MALFGYIDRRPEAERYNKMPLWETPKGLIYDHLG